MYNNNISSVKTFNSYHDNICNVFRYGRIKQKLRFIQLETSGRSVNDSRY